MGISPIFHPPLMNQYEPMVYFESKKPPFFSDFSLKHWFWIPGLVNVNRTMENKHFNMGKSLLNEQISIAVRNYRRVIVG